MMKRMIAVLALVVVFVMAFAACSGSDTKTGTCDLCGTENVSVTGITLEGETGYFCGDCYDTAKAMADMYSSGALDAYM